MQDWLNYHHLRYFWEAARAGTISAAAVRLRLAQPTVSTQIRTLEEHLGQRLFDRRGRKLVLTPAGERAFHYAERIFGLGSELLESFDPEADAVAEIRVGVSDALSKLMVAKIIEPLMRAGPENSGSQAPVHVVCHEDKSTRLIAELTLHAYDVVLADEPVGPSAQGSAENHALGSCGVTFFAAQYLAVTLRDDFPRSLHGAPVLLPTPNTTMRRALDHWFLAHDIRPHVVGAFEDSALLKTVGAGGAGAFPVASAASEPVASRFGVVEIGTLTEVREPLYAITLRRGQRSPAVDRLIELGRGLLAQFA